MIKPIPFLMLFSFLQACSQKDPVNLWRAAIASNTQPLITHGTVYVKGITAGHPEEATRLFALNAQDGKERWVSADTVQELYGEAGGFVFLQNKQGRLVQLKADTGEKVFESADADHPILRWAIREDDMFVINETMEVVAVDCRQNKMLWNTRLPLRAGDQAELQIVGDFLLVSGNLRPDSSNYFGMLWALDLQTGKEMWHFEAPSPHDYAPLKVLGNGAYVLVTNTSPLVLKTYVLDTRTGKEYYPAIPAFDFYGCEGDHAYAPNGVFDLKTGQRISDNPHILGNGVIHGGISWQMKMTTVNALKAFALRTEYDGDRKGRRDWLNTPPNTSLIGIDLQTGKQAYQGKEYPYTECSIPVINQGVLYYSSLALMKEGKSGVWAFQLPE